jgi:hypothetical protein
VVEGLFIGRLLREADDYSTISLKCEDYILSVKFFFVPGLRRTSPPSMPSPRSEYGIHPAGNPPFSFSHVAEPRATEMARNLQKFSVITWKKWNEMLLPIRYTVYVTS